MMKVVGEEGTSLDDYVLYLKGEFLDSVYLQQNSFDPVDALGFARASEEDVPPGVEHSWGYFENGRQGRRPILVL